MTHPGISCLDVKSKLLLITKCLVDKVSCGQEDGGVLVQVGLGVDSITIDPKVTLYVNLSSLFLSTMN